MFTIYFRTFFFFIGLLFIAESLAESSVPTLWNISSENKYFTGRKEIIKEINETFSKNPHDTLAITGLSGMGKSQIAKQYAHQFKSNYDIVWWFDASKDIESQIITLIEEWNISKKANEQIQLYNKDNAIKLFKKKLRTSNLNWLFIYDNANEKKDMYIPEKHGKGLAHVLITSKVGNIWDQIIKLNNLSLKHSVNFLKKFNLNFGDDKKYFLLAEALHGYPLALAQAASYISITDSTIDDYLKLYKGSTSNNLGYNKIFKKKLEGTAALDGYQEDNHATISLLLNELKKHSQEAYEVLTICAFFHYDDISEDLIKLYFKGYDQKKRFNDTIIILQHYILLEPSQSRNNKDKYKKFFMHEMLQKVIIKNLTKSEKEYYLGLAATILKNIFTKNSENMNVFLMQKPYLFSHIEKVLSHEEKIILPDHLKNWLYFIKALYFLWIKSDINMANDVYNKLGIALRTSKDKQLKVKYYFYKSSLETDYIKFNHNDSINTLKKALSMIKGNDDKIFTEDKITINFRIAEYYFALGDIKNFNTYLNTGEELFLNSKENQKYPYFYYFLKAKKYMLEGNYLKAEEYIKNSFANINYINENQELTSFYLPINSYIPIYFYYSFFKAENEQAKEALDLAIYSYDLSTKSFNKQTIHAIFSLAVLIKACIKNNDFIQATNYLRIAKKDLQDEKLSKTKHIIISLLMIMEGEINQHNKAYIEAYLNFKEAEKFYQENLKDLSIDMVSSLYYKIMEFAIETKNDALLNQYFIKHRDLFGIEHKRTKSIIEQLIQKNYPLPL